MTHRRSVPALATLALGLAALSGCTHPENERFRLGDAGTIPAFQPQRDTLADPTPSVYGLDRDNWETVDFVVPVHGTAHHPTYAPSAFCADTLARQRGEYPTAETCLELNDPNEGDEALEAVATHGAAVLDTLLLVPRMVIRPPCATDWSPAGTYTRVSGQDPAPRAAHVEIEASDTADGDVNEVDSR